MNAPENMSMLFQGIASNNREEFYFEDNGHICYYRHGLKYKDDGGVELLFDDRKNAINDVREKLNFLLEWNRDRKQNFFIEVSKVTRDEQGEVWDKIYVECVSDGERAYASPLTIVPEEEFVKLVVAARPIDETRTQRAKRFIEGLKTGKEIMKYSYMI